MSRRATGIGLFALAAYASGCSWTHRCTVPTPVVEAAPGPRLPIAVEVRYAPPAVPAEVTQEKVGGMYAEHRVVVNAVPPTREMFDRLAASLFERTVSAPPADAILEIRLDRFGVGTSPNSASSEVAYRATVWSADGAEVAVFAVEGVSTVAASLRHLGFCGARGEAVAVAMQQAGETLVRKVSESDALAAWLAARGSAPVRFTVKPFDAYAEPTLSTSATPSQTKSASASEPPRAAPVPVRAGPPPAPLAPRSFRLRVGAAQFRAESTAGKLEDPSKGLAVTAMGGEVRLTSVLRLDIDVEFAERSYSATYVPHYTGFGPRTTLDSTSVGAGLRASPPLGDRPPVEPWVGASARIMHTRLKVTYFGGLSGGESIDTAWSVGADVGGGVNFYLGERWGLGVDVRWRFAHANLTPLGSVGIGGLLIGGSLVGVLPP